MALSSSPPWALGTTGDACRGIVCDAGCDPAGTTTIREHSGRICSEHRRTRGDWELTGEGRQLSRYRERACKVCLASSSSLPLQSAWLCPVVLRRPERESEPVLPPFRGQPAGWDELRDEGGPGVLRGGRVPGYFACLIPVIADEVRWHLQSLSCRGKALVKSSYDCPRRTDECDGTASTAAPTTRSWKPASAALSFSSLRALAVTSSFLKASGVGGVLGARARRRAASGACPEAATARAPPAPGSGRRKSPARARYASASLLIRLEKEESFCVEECLVWSAWGTWSTCSVTCGAGRQTRRRSCSGALCYSQASSQKTEERACGEDYCPWSR